MAVKVQHSPADATALRVSAYDRVAGLLIAGLFLGSFVVGTMLVLWLSSRVWHPVAPIAVDMQPEEVGGGTGPQRLSEEFVEPSSDETPAEKVDHSLEAIVSTISTPELAEQLTTSEWSSTTANKPGHSGNPRGPYIGDGPLNGTATWERWKIDLNATTLEEYAQQLDFFEIELGVAGGGSPHVTYVSQLSKARPKVRTGSPQDEKRLRFLHQSGVLRDADRKLVQKAGADPGGKVVFQFYSKETHTALLLLEYQAKGDRPLSAVLRTVFGVRETAPGKYEFYVVSQEYR